MRLSRAVIALIALALLVGPQGALGATQLSKSGKIGPWFVRDTIASPAGTCIYDADVPGAQGNDIDIMEARSPKVWARDRSSGRDGQWVGARIIFQRSVDEGGTGGWVKAKATPLKKKFAYDNKAVTFGKRTWLVDTDVDYHFRVIALIRWYKPGSKKKVQGTARILYQRYLAILGLDERVDDERCLPEY